MQQPVDSRRFTRRHPAVAPYLPKVGGGSRIEWITLPGSLIGHVRRFGIYLPVGWGRARRKFPVLYLFRGHETEWAGAQDGREGLLRVLDRKIATGEIDPLLVVLPGFMSDDRTTQAVPVNWSEPAAYVGAGTGRFEDHFFEVKSFVERHLHARVGKSSTALDGFSMGGYSALLLAARYPQLFGSCGAYDGSFMWPGQMDPRRGPKGRADRLWFSPTCAAMFRAAGRWDRVKMERHNPTHLIARARGMNLRELKKIRFHLRSAAAEIVGNCDRLDRVLSIMATRGLVNSFAGEDRRLDPAAIHTWAWADRHLDGTLDRHDAFFKGR